MNSKFIQGTWALGGAWNHNDNPFGCVCRKKTANTILRKGLDLGISYFDTAPGYGKDGYAEHLIGNLDKELRKSDARIISKVGRVLGPVGLKPI